MAAIEKVRIAKRFMDKIPLVYEKLLKLHPDGMPSIGMVARYDRVGSGGGSVSSITETTAMRSLALTEAQRQLMDWFDAVYEVYFKLFDKTGKSPVKAQHDRKLAVVLKGRVFDDRPFKDIKDMHFREQVSVQYVQNLYKETVWMVAEEADRRGLYKGLLIEGQK